MRANVYSAEKMAWWLLQDKVFPPPAPKQVQVVISDLCSHSCSFCAYRMDGYSSNQLFTKDAELAAYGKNNPKRFIPTVKVLAILQDAVEMGISGIQFTGGGEPTVHPEHESIFQSTLDLGLAAALVSHGARWSDRLIQDILPWFAWVRVSVDAGRAETYAAIRGTPARSFATAWGNITSLAKSRKPGLVLGVGFVVTPENYREIAEAAILARNAGADYLRVSAMFSQHGAVPFEPIYADVKQGLEECKALETEHFRIHDLFGDRIEDLVDGPPDYELCSYQHYNTYIGGDSNVYRCCVLAYNERGLLGSVKNRSLKEFWASPETREKLMNFDARGCSVCQFHQKNRTMAYLLGPRPAHIEFP